MVWLGRLEAITPRVISALNDPKTDSELHSPDDPIAILLLSPRRSPLIWRVFLNTTAG